jgi:hypothetical protein
VRQEVSICALLDQSYIHKTTLLRNQYIYYRQQYTIHKMRLGRSSLIPPLTILAIYHFLTPDTPIVIRAYRYQIGFPSVLASHESLYSFGHDCSFVVGARRDFSISCTTQLRAPADVKYPVAVVMFSVRFAFRDISSSRVFTTFNND